MRTQFRYGLYLSLFWVTYVLVVSGCSQKSSLQGTLGQDGSSSLGTPIPNPTPAPTSMPTPIGTAVPTPVPTPNPTPILISGNILTNGDFSKGLECYGGYDWGSSGGFFLSTDAHSAPYSAELACNGSGCGKQNLQSGAIPFTAGKSYLLQVYTKCAAGGSGSVYLANTVNGATSQAVTCNGSWNNTQVTFTPAAGTTTFSFAIYNMTDVTPLFIDDIVLTYSDGTVPAPNSWVHPGIRNVTLSPTTVSVDGNPYLALGFTTVPSASFAQAAGMGTNTIMGTADCFQTGGVDILDQAYNLGMNAIPDSTMATRAALDNGSLGANGSAGALTLPNAVSRYAPHLANIGWFLDDEPDQSAVRWYLLTPPTLVSEASAVRSKTTLPTFVDFQHAAYTTEDPGYNGSSDVWMAEPYGSNFTSVVTAINTLEKIQQRPIWLFQNDINSNLIVPKAYFAIVNGATGIIYFNWGSFSADAPALAAAGQVFSELGSFKNAIFGSSVAVTAPTGITAMGRSYQGKTYIFAVEPNTITTSGNFTVSGLPTGTTITVQFENRTITSTAGGFSDSFSGVTRHVYIY